MSFNKDLIKRRFNRALLSSINVTKYQQKIEYLIMGYLIKKHRIHVLLDKPKRCVIMLHNLREEIYSLEYYIYFK